MTKSRYLLIIILLSLLFQSVQASVIYYPPQATYNWQQGDSNGVTSSTINNDWIVLTARGDGAYNFVVTDAIDLTDISHISIDWRGDWISWNPAFYRGNITFGISTVQGDTSYTLYMAQNSSDFNITTNLSVLSYYGNYFLKVGVNISLSGTLDDMTLWVFNVTGHNYSSSYPISILDSSITTTTATLRGHVTNDSDMPITCGFWIGNASTTAVNFEQNVTCTGTYTVGETFSRAVTSLNPANYYYVRSWTDNGYSFNTSQNESYFLTIPNATSNFFTTSSGAGSIGLQWVNASITQGLNHSVLIRYSTSGPPSSITSGTFGDNESINNFTTISGLPEETTIYFSAWTYINGTGSPLRHAFSSSYQTCSNSTTGGNYNISVRYENESFDNNYLVSLARYSIHRLIIYYTTGQDEITFDDGVCTTSVNGYFGSNSFGWFNITLDDTPLYFEFRWNDSNGSDMYCTRLIVPTTGQRNITFYIRTNCFIYPETTVYLNSTNTLLKYHYSYLDSTGLFVYPNNPYCEIYRYNSSNTRLLIHSEYFDQEGKTHPWLVYDNRYYQGVYCDILSYSRIGIAPATDETDQDEIRIPLTLEDLYIFYDLIELDYAWGTDGFYVNYQDTTSSTDWVAFSVYYFINDTFIHIENVSSINIVNFTFTQAEGCNTSRDYKFLINTSLNADINVYYEGFYQSGKIPMYVGMSAITSNATLDYYFQLIFGPSPLYYYGNTDIFVPWTYILVFGLCFIVLCTFGKLNAFLGGLGVGLTLCFSGGAIIGIQTLFSNYAWWEGPVLIVIGAFVIALSIIALMGGIEK